MRILFFLILIVVTSIYCGSAFANSAPVVGNVTASQRGDDSKLVDIYYSLADADGDTCTVWAFVSDNNGVSWRVPAWAFSGHVGSGIAPGSKHIVWDAATDIPGKIGSYKVRVYADDGNGTAPKVLVPGGSFPYQNTTNPDNWAYVDSFLIDKYEVTNQFYCQFLNSTGWDDAWDSRMEIERTGTSGNYIYTVRAGKENFPVRYPNCYDAEAFCSWRSTIEGVTYRLPTEQEWEKAAAWDPVEQHFYYYGFHSDTINCTYSNYNNCVGTTTEVGRYNGTEGRQNAKSYYGCYDMTGNVREWTYDSSTSSHYRGGGFNDDGVATTYYIPSYLSKNSRYAVLGFRCVMVVDE